MKNVLISIGIPAYKSEYLGDAIQSVLKQTYSYWELIIVDDSSPNNIRGVISNFHYSRIKYYRNKSNIGGGDPSKNWNVCLNYAKGEYFCLLCDDDLYEPEFLEEMLKLSQKYQDCNVFRSRVKIIDSRKKDEEVDFYPSSPEWESCEDYIWHVGRNLRKQTISEWMLRTGHIRKCRGYANLPFAWGADYLSIYQFCINGGIASTTKSLVAYRRSKINISTMAEKNCKEKMLANKLFKESVNTLIETNGFSYKLKEEVIRHKDLADIYILSHVDFCRFCYFIKYRKKYNISTKAFLKAVEGKLILLMQ